MTKAHCSKHKRYVPTCIGCQSEALKETVGFPKQPEGEAQTEPKGGPYPEGAPGPDANNESDDEGGDIAEWEPEVEEEELPPRPSEEPPNHPDPWADSKTLAEGDDTGDWKPPAEREPAPLPSYKPADPDSEEAKQPDVHAEAEIDGAGQIQSVSLVPGEGEPDIHPNIKIVGHPDMEPIDVAMALFPRRLIPEGATEVCDEEHPDEPYMASYEELVRRAVAGYLEVGLTPEDAVIVVAAAVIQAEKMESDFGGAPEEAEAVLADDTEAFEAGLEAAPELTGCIEDYNSGFNTGMDTLLDTLVGYYGGDMDAPAFSMLEWLRVQMAGMKR